MDFYTKCYIPSLGKEIGVNKLQFGDYIQLNSYIQSEDIENTHMLFEKICEKSLKNIENYTNLDKFVLLIHLHLNYLGNILKLSAKDEESNKITYEVFLKNIIKDSKKYKINGFRLPKKLYYSDVSEILEETGKSEDDIKKHIEDNKILMFECPDNIKGIPKVYFNCFDNTLFHFIKFIYSTDMKSLYKKIKSLKKEYNFLLSEIYEMSPKEMDLFLSSK